MAEPKLKNGEWDLMKKLAYASNNGDDQGVAAIIINSDLNENKRLAQMAVNCFKLTKSNIVENIDAAVKLSKLIIDSDFGCHFRICVLNDMLGDLK